MYSLCFTGLLHQWIDGTPVNVLFWEPGEPSNMGSEHCAEMFSNNGLWNNRDCSHTLNYVCQVKKGNVKISQVSWGGEFLTKLETKGHSNTHVGCSHLSLSLYQDDIDPSHFTIVIIYARTLFVIRMLAFCLYECCLHQLMHLAMSTMTLFS